MHNNSVNFEVKNMNYIFLYSFGHTIVLAMKAVYNTVQCLSVGILSLFYKNGFITFGL